MGNSLILLAVLAVVLAALGTWVYLRSVRHLYRLRHDRPERKTVRCGDGWELSIYHRPSTHRRYREPLLLCHGLAANHYNWDFDPPYSPARVFAEAGFECYSVDWRGTLGSMRAPAG